MDLTKHAHACVSLEKEGRRLVIDPGTFTPDAGEAVAAAGAILVTHEHPDHLDEAVITAALEQRPELALYGPEAVVGRWRRFGDRVVAVAHGDRFDVEGFEVSAYGERHAVIHRDLPVVSNIGYLIDAKLFHPGDAYCVPPARVTTLLLPTSGLRTHFADAVDYVRVVNPTTLIQIHELMLSDLGQRYAANLLSPPALTSVPLTVLSIGETVRV